MLNLDTSIEFLKSIGSERAKIIRNILGISTVEDFLTFYPLRYLDKSKIYLIKDLNEDLPDVQLKGRITDLQEISSGKIKRLAGKFQDESGTMDLVWFRYSKWMKEQIPINKELFIFGKATLFNNTFSMAHPEIEIDEKREPETRLKPIYQSSEKYFK